MTDDLTNVGMFESSDIIGPIPTHQSHKAQSLQTGDDKLLQDKAAITPYHETIHINDREVFVALHRPKNVSFHSTAEKIVMQVGDVGCLPKVPSCNAANFTLQCSAVLSLCCWRLSTGTTPRLTLPNQLFVLIQT